MNMHQNTAKDGKERWTAKRDWFCLTTTARMILKTLDHCHTRADMGVVIGAAGVGKTTTLSYYADTEEWVYIATMSPATAALNKMLHTVGQAMHIWGRSPPYADIVSGLRERRRRCLLIIDESQHLENRALDGLRSIRDESGCGLILAGNPSVVTRFGGNKEAMFAQFLSRIGMYCRLDRIFPEDCEALCDHHQVVGARARTILKRISNRPGGLRTIGNIINVARDDAGRGKPIELQHIQDAIAHLGMEE
jgi:hypothetical protein